MDVVIDGIEYKPIAPTLPKNLTLGKFLKAARKTLGVTLDRASFDIGCSKSYLCELENDRGEPSLRIAARISNTYGIRLEEIAQHLTPHGRNEAPAAPLAAGRLD